MVPSICDMCVCMCAHTLVHVGVVRCVGMRERERERDRERQREKGRKRDREGERGIKENHLTL